MNPRLPWALLLALLTVAAAPAATFEGKVEMKMSSNGKPAQDMSYQIREGQMRIEVAGKGGMTAIMVMDLAKRQMMIIMPAQKMYMIRAMPSPSDAPRGAGGPPAQYSKDPGEAPPITKTGETAKILGYDCVKYIVQGKTDGSTTDLWVTDELGNFGGLGGMGGGAPGGRMGMGPPPAPPAWEKALMGKGFFPLRVVGKDAGGKEKFRLDVVSVEKQTLSDDLFAPPAGYRALDLGNLMGGMSGMMPH